jgi:hypothetical protein
VQRRDRHAGHVMDLFGSEHLTSGFLGDRHVGSQWCWRDRRLSDVHEPSGYRNCKQLSPRPCAQSWCARSGPSPSQASSSTMGATNDSDWVGVTFDVSKASSWTSRPASPRGRGTVWRIVHPPISPHCSVAIQPPNAPHLTLQQHQSKSTPPLTLTDIRPQHQLPKKAFGTLAQGAILVVVGWGTRPNHPPGQLV